MKRQDSLKTLETYADFTESLGIIKKWQDSSDKENKDLTRLAELQLGILNAMSLMARDIKDLEGINSYIRETKNKEILSLRDELSKNTL